MATVKLNYTGNPFRILVSGTSVNLSSAEGPQDGVFMPTSGDISFVYRIPFPARPGAAEVLTGTHVVRVGCRPDTGSNPPSLAVHLYVNGTQRVSLRPLAVLSAEAVLTYNVTNAQLGAVSLADQIELYVEVVSSGGNPNSRETVQFDFFEVELEYEIQTVFEDVADDAVADAGYTFDFAYATSDIVEPYYTLTYEAGPVTDDILDDASAFAERINTLRTSYGDFTADVTASTELVSQGKNATQDVLEEATATAETASQRKDATQDVLEGATPDPVLVSQTRAAAIDADEDVNGDESILTDVQTGPAGEELTEEVDREDTILQQIATFRQDVEEVAAYNDELVSSRLDAVEDVEELEVAGADITLETPFYRQALEELASLESSVIGANLDASTDLASDTNADGDPLTLVAVAIADVAEETLAEGYYTEVKTDDILETATATAEVPVDPLREDIYEWIWPRARIANTYVADVEEAPVARDAAFTKLLMDILVDVDALASVQSERRGNRTDLTETATVEDLYTATIAALADMEQEAYIGSAITKGAGSFYNTLVDDANGSDELTQRLVTRVELTADANGRDDVAGSVWFKAHSFIEEASGDDTLLTELVRRPTKDDVTAEAGANATLETGYLAAVTAWSEEGLAEAELLGNESGEAWVFNSRTLAFSRYVDFDASQVTTVDSEPLAVGVRGVMTYSDSRAEGYVKTGLSDYGAPQLKRIRHAYVTAASRQPLALSTLHGIGDVLSRTTYQIDTLDSTVPYTHRLNLARGDQGQFWAFELRAPAGPPTTLLNLRIIPLVTSRRI